MQQIDRHYWFRRLPDEPPLIHWAVLGKIQGMAWKIYQYEITAHNIVTIFEIYFSSIKYAVNPRRCMLNTWKIYILMRFYKNMMLWWSIVDHYSAVLWLSDYNQCNSFEHRAVSDLRMSCRDVGNETACLNVKWKTQRQHLQGWTLGYVQQIFRKINDCNAIRSHHTNGIEKSYDSRSSSVPLLTLSFCFILDNHSSKPSYEFHCGQIFT